MNKFLRATTLWLWGGFIYYLIELIWRGHSHPSMFVVGGLCFVTIGGLNNHLPWSMSLVKQSLIGSGIITVLEFAAGLIVNVWLGWNVWDYSNVPLNILGQICVPFVIAWIPLATVAIVLDDYLRYYLFKEERPHYWLI